MTKLNFYYRLEGSGQTALGPALYASIRIAARLQGSKVVLCTDGVANLGLGSLAEPLNPESKEFYHEIASYAKSKGYEIKFVKLFLFISMWIEVNNFEINKIKRDFVDYHN